METNLADITLGFPAEMHQFYKYCREGMDFYDVPDYGYLKSLLYSVIFKENFKTVMCYSWQLKQSTDLQQLQERLEGYREQQLKPKTPSNMMKSTPSNRVGRRPSNCSKFSSKRVQEEENDEEMKYMMGVGTPNKGKEEEDGIFIDTVHRGYAQFINGSCVSPQAQRKDFRSRSDFEEEISGFGGVAGGVEQNNQDEFVPEKKSVAGSNIGSIVGGKPMSLTVGTNSFISPIKKTPILRRITHKHSNPNSVQKKKPVGNLSQKRVFEHRGLNNEAEMKFNINLIEVSEESPVHFPNTVASKFRRPIYDEQIDELQIEDSNSVKSRDVRSGRSNSHMDVFNYDHPSKREIILNNFLMDMPNELYYEMD